MKNLLINCTILLALITLTGCSSSNDSTASSEPFRIVIPLVQGSAIKTNFSGYDSDGNNLSGFKRTEVRAEALIAGQSTIPVAVTVSISINGETPVAVSGFQFYSAVENRLLAYTVGAETFTGLTANNVPSYANIGDSGTIGTYESDLGYTDTQTWTLTDAGNGNAYLTVTIEAFDNVLNSRFSTSVEQRLIDTNGNQLGFSVSVSIFQDINYSFNLNSI